MKIKGPIFLSSRTLELRILSETGCRMWFVRFAVETGSMTWPFWKNT
jgi:hypothetical protein